MLETALNSVTPLYCGTIVFTYPENRCQILRLKCTKFDFGWGSAPDPAGELTALPTPPSWIWGPYF